MAAGGIAEGFLQDGRMASATAGSIGVLAL
jgi:hypothetical protein